MRYSPLALALLIAAPVAPAHADSPLETSVTAADVDLATTRRFRDGVASKTAPGHLARLLDLREPAAPWIGGHVRQWKTAKFHYRLTFKRPVAVGTLMVKIGGDARRARDRRVRFLKPDAEFPGDPNNDDDWFAPERVLRRHGYRTVIAEPGFTTRAILCSETRDLLTSQIDRIVILKSRLVDRTPYLTGQGQPAPGAWWPGDIPAGDPWHGAGPIGEEEHVRRRPVTSLDPCWFVLSRDRVMRPVAMRLRANADVFRIYAFTGGERDNPALAPKTDWSRVTYTEHPGGVLELNPTSARAYKVVILETRPREEKVAIINEWTLWEDLGDADPPPPAPPPPPSPFAIDYELAADGETTVVIDDMDGFRLRNLIAQTARPAGANQQAWDLKDMNGNYVLPGTYRLRGIYGPQPRLIYQHTYYPNVEAHSPDSRPWVGRPQDGWLANHANQTAACAAGDRLYIAAGGTEGGHAFIETDLKGQKLWGARFGANELFTDGTALFMRERQQVSRFDAKERKRKHLFDIRSVASGGGELRGLAAHDNQVYAAYYSGVPYFAQTLGLGHIDVERCLPRLPEAANPPQRDYRAPAEPRRDFFRNFRLTGTPSGVPAAGSLDHIPSTDLASHRQYVVLAFNGPQPIGSVVFPRPLDTNLVLTVGALKADAPYPPNPRREGDWIAFPDAQPQPWDVLAAPPETTTRALRLVFSRPGEEELGEGLDESMAEGGEVSGDIFDDGDDVIDELLHGNAWQARIDGMRIVRRRLTNLVATATVHVNSGSVDPVSGVWEAERERAVVPDDPGIYMLTWPTPQPLVGLAINEIDGLHTEIDVYNGPAKGVPDIDEPVGKNWRRVARYRQKVRGGAMGSPNNNARARYLDGFVNFGREIRTRAVRLRVVEQWTRGAGRRPDRGGSVIDQCRCAVYGVAPVAYLGGEPRARTAEQMQRLEVRSGDTGELIRETHSRVNNRMAFGPNGELFAIDRPRIVAIDRETGQVTRTVVKDAGDPIELDLDRQGNLYVFNNAPGQRVTQAYSPEGKYLHNVGTAGDLQSGLWDPGRLGDLADIDVDDHDNVWLTYPHDNPRRIVHFKTDGTFVQEFLGNTAYGGGGVLDRYDKTLAYHKDVVFKLDWGKDDASPMTSRVHALLDWKFWESGEWKGFRKNTVPVLANGRRYMVTAPLSYEYWQRTGYVYLVDPETFRMRLVAAVGRVIEAPFVSQPEFAQALQGKDLGLLLFTWADRNGNGDFDVEEMEFEPMDRHWLGFGRFDRDLGIMGGTIRYEVKEFLGDGVPVYHRVPVKGLGGMYRLDNGDYFGHRGMGLHQRHQNIVTEAKTGKVRWAYDIESGGVSGLWISGWQPGKVANQFGIIGHETASGGDLGEFVVLSSNTGQWHLWTVDGLLASYVTHHTGDPRPGRNGWWGPNNRGRDMSGLSAGQEHFHAFFCTTIEDGRSYIVAGGAQAGIIEVQGLNEFKRFAKTITVTPEQLDAVREWESRRLRRLLFERLPTVEANLRSPLVGGWAGQPTPPADLGFLLAYDSERLYIQWQVVQQGRLANSATDARRAFQTGASVELNLQTDPAADPNRTEPAPGDLRIVATRIGGKLTATLYRPHAPGAPATDAWTAKGHRPAAFDQVVRLDNAEFFDAPVHAGFGIAVAIPLKDLGLKPERDLVLKMDWGVTTTEDGKTTARRRGWANSMAAVTPDDADAARLHPDRWGYVRFLGPRKSELEKAMGDTHEQDLQEIDIEDLMDGLEDDL